MANTRFGNFSNLVSDPKEYDKNAREGFNKLAETALELTPGPEIAKVFGQDNYGPMDAVTDLQDKYVPFAYQYNKWLRGEEVDPNELAAEAILLGLPLGGEGLRVVNRAIKNPKSGFIRNPAYKEPMTKAQQEATDKAIKEWNKGVAINRRSHAVRPENIPAPVTYEQKALNQINDYISNQFKFTPKVSNEMGLPVANSNIVTKAILPEDAADAAFLRHNPVMSNYDAINKVVTQNIGKFAKEGKLKTGEPHSILASDPRYDGQYVIKYKTNNGGYRDQGNRSKRNMLLMMEEMFPGFLEAMAKPLK